MLVHSLCKTSCIFPTPHRFFPESHRPLTTSAPKRRPLATGPAVTPPPYVHVKRLVYATATLRPKKPGKEDVQVCACRPPPRPGVVDGRRAAGGGSPSIACGRYCLNRSTHVLCDVKQCPAGDACTNKPFDALPCPKLEVFRTEHCGFGLRTCEDVKRGAFVAEYLGEVIDMAEYRRRLANAKHSNTRDFYMMALGMCCCCVVEKRCLELPPPCISTLVYTCDYKTSFHAGLLGPTQAPAASSTPPAKATWCVLSTAAVNPTVRRKSGQTLPLGRCGWLCLPRRTLQQGRKLRMTTGLSMRGWGNWQKHSGACVVVRVLCGGCFVIVVHMGIVVSAVYPMCIAST